jgi:hypothetical protein
MECIQEAGDWIYIPSSWSSATLHLAESVGFSARFHGQVFDEKEFTFETTKDNTNNNSNDNDDDMHSNIHDKT